MLYFTRIVPTAAMTCVLAAHAHSAVIYTPVAVQGQAVPGVPGATWAQFLGGFGIGSPVLSNTGEVAFRAFMSGPPSGSDTGIFSGMPGATMPWTREGSALPTGGGVFGHTSSNQEGFPVIGAGGVRAGHVPATGGASIVIGGAGGPTIAHRVGHAAVGLPAGVTMSSYLSDPTVSDSGAYSFRAWLAGGGFDFRVALYSNHGGSMVPLAVTGNAVPGMAGATFNAFGPATFGGSSTAFEAVTSAGQAIMSDRSGSLAPLVKAGDVAPSSGGATFTTVRTPTLGVPHAPAYSATGRVAFMANLSNGSTGLYTDAGGALRKIGQQFEAIPGMAGASWGSFSLTPPVSINSRGDVSFYNEAFIGGFSNDTVFVDRGSTIDIIAREGGASPIPGLAYGTIDKNSIRLNNSGLVAFVSALSGAGVNSSNDMGLFAIDQVGSAPIMVLREGDTFDVFGDGSVFKTISLFEFSIQSDSNQFTPSPGLGGGHAAFNDHDTLAFLLRFTDGTQGIYTARVPGPGAASIGLVVIGLTVSRRRPSGAAARG